ncbi:MAG TPA: hypothetical protein VG294_00405 [Solirubrobacteraceae bacterium]|jgi:hypothetical protein|nr:hypothetical protein [Solirubrobacteraceae bacterium]
MSPLKPNQTARSRIEALQRENAAMKRTLHAIRSEPFGAQEALDSLDDELGDGATDPITMAGLKAGQFSPEELADRLPEVEAVLSGRPVTGSPVSRADVLAMTAEQVADFGAERAMAIVNGEADR